MKFLWTMKMTLTQIFQMRINNKTKIYKLNNNKMFNKKNNKIYSINNKTLKIIIKKII